jgi:hypothetical protein
MRLRVAPLPASSRSDRVAFPGCPFLAPFLPSRRPNPQVSPWLRSFGCAGDGCSSYPEPLMPSAVPVSARFRVAPSPAFLLRRPRCRTWVAPRPASPALPAMDHRVAPMLASFGGADLPVPELPRAPAFRYRRRFVVQVAPHFESSGTD